jgi:predicted ABC-type ATPase
MKNAVFMLGLPGSGKSYYIEKFYPNSDYKIVSADEIRINDSEYNPKDPQAIHQKCIKMAEDEVYRLAGKENNIVMDGGGINNHYTSRIIENLKSLGYHIKTVFIDTPAEICIYRNKDRYKSGERFVPISAIIEKSYKLKKSVELLSNISDKFETVKYFTNGHIFCDLDGTLVEYQNLLTDENGNINFVGHEVFKYAKPVPEMINKLGTLANYGKHIYVVSASPNSIASAEKIEWLCKYAPFIKKENIYFVGNKAFKYVFLDELISKLKLNQSDCMAIDDDHSVLENYKKLNINAIHPSNFLANY